MPKSMTAYGRAHASVDELSMDMELRSVNSRYFEFNLRAPGLLQAYENSWKNLIKEHISRGKLELRVSYFNAAGGDAQLLLNESKARAYGEAYERLAELLHEEAGGKLAFVASKGEVFSISQDFANAEKVQELALRTLSLALEDFDAMRRREGENLSRDLLKGLDQLEEKVKALSEKAPMVPEIYRRKLLARVEELLGDQREEYYNGQRVAAEIAIFADKADVREELTRLRSHLDQFRFILSQDKPAGKKLDFLIQEMNRECNTTGSKCNDLEMTRLVVEAKTLVEQLREQIQNLE